MNEIVVAFKNQGKSTLAYAIARSKRKPTLIYDEHEVFTDVGEVVTLDELDERLNEQLKPSDILVYNPPGDDEEREFDEFGARIWKPRNVTILIDEASYIQTSGHVSRYLKKLIRLNEERYNVDLIQASHRITDLSTFSRSQSWDWYIGFTPDKRDLDIIREKWGDAVADEVEAIPFDSHYFVHVSATMRSYIVNREPEKWYRSLHPQVTAKDEHREVVTSNVTQER